MRVRRESDEELYARWKTGDEHAGQTLARRHSRPIHRFFANKVPDDAEELLQKTFLACLSARHGPTRSFRGFLFGVARNQLLRHAEGRDQPRDEELVSHISCADPSSSITERIRRYEQNSILHEAMGLLSLDDRIALELYYWQRLPVDEVADVLGLSPGGTRAKLHRARTRLKRHYGALADDSA
jgi:RNA polymerase sigma-70 factor (ECF subfamily)